MIMELLNIISANAYTIIALKKRVRILKEYLEKQFFGGNVNLNLSPEDQFWLNSLPKTLLASFNKDNFYKLIEELNEQITSIKPLVVYIAFDMPDPQLALLTQYIRKSLMAPLLFLEVKQNPILIAGAAFVYKGVYKDYSLKGRIEQNKEKILLEFKRSLE